MVRQQLQRVFSRIVPAGAFPCCSLPFSHRTWKRPSAAAGIIVPRSSFVRSYWNGLAKPPVEHETAANAVTFDSFPQATEYELERQKTDNVQADVDEQVLKWKSVPKNVLMVKKITDPKTTIILDKIADFLQKRFDCNIFIEPSAASAHPHLYAVHHKQHAHAADYIDVAVSLGGDGTILHLSHMFEHRIPPVIGFSLGTLGFMTPFDIATHEYELEKVFTNQARATRRTRLRCFHYKNDGQMKPVVTHTVLNEVAINKGSFGLIQVDLTVDGLHLTRLKGDGIIVATPTGSTGYALSAGGCMVHPSVDSVLVTPVCPRSLSFRPVLLPAKCDLSVKVIGASPANAIGDGQYSHSMEDGDSVNISKSEYPFLTFVRSSATTDWCEDINERLYFNKSYASRRILDS